MSNGSSGICVYAWMGRDGDNGVDDASGWKENDGECECEALVDVVDGENNDGMCVAQVDGVNNDGVCVSEKVIAGVEADVRGMYW